MVVEKAYAKLNLSLNVLEKRSDGFHNLESIMVPVTDLYDILEFSKRDDNNIHIEGMDIKDNIVEKAAILFQEKYYTGGVSIKINKHIPVAAGLAGGSADASATLRGLNRLFGLNLPLKELEELALLLGSDTVFCLYNKAAICRGRGEILEFIDFDFSLPVWILKPSFGLLTKEVFSNLEIKQSVINTNELLLALKNNNLKELNVLITNDLYIPATIVNPILKTITNILKDNNIVSHMSGSGSTIYFIDNLNTNYKEYLEKVLLSNGVEYVYLGKHIVKNTVCDCK